MENQKSNWWIEEYKKYHREQNDYGNGGALKFHKRHIDDLILDTKAETLLDFGCGKGDVYEVNDWDWPMPTLYDPAIQSMMSCLMVRFTVFCPLM